MDEIFDSKTPTFGIPAPLFIPWRTLGIYTQKTAREQYVISYKDHFVQRPFRTRETRTQESLRTRFLYELVPDILHTHAESNFVQGIVYENIYIFSTMKLGFMYVYLRRSYNLLENRLQFS